jgi:hypothetical protein
MYYKRKMRLRVVSVSTPSCGLCPFSPHTWPFSSWNSIQQFVHPLTLGSLQCSYSL